MNAEELLKLLKENISLQLRHANYERAIEVRKFSHMAITGEGQGDEIKKYRRFESEDLKDQRERLYNSLTPYALARPRKYWKKINRIEGIRLTLDGPNEAEIEKIKDDFFRFLPGETLEQWTGRTTEYLGVTDPNAWILFEREDYRNAEFQITKTRVVPHIFNCADVLNFQRHFGAVNWVLFRRTEIEISIKNGASTHKQLENFFLYAPGMIVRAREVGDNTVMLPGEVVETIPIFAPATPGSREFNNNSTPFPVPAAKERTFYVSVISNGSKEVPAICVGAYLDELTGHESFVTWFEPAKHVLKDLMKVKSSLDTVLTLHTYPKRWEFVKPCKFQTDSGSVCEGGYLNGIHDGDHLCPACNGTAKAVNFTTEQEVLQLSMPEDPALMLELSKLAFTEPTDTALPTFLNELLETIDKRIMSCIFDSGLYQKPTDSKARTATEVNSVMDGISDVLQPYCDLYSRVIELAYRMAFQYREIDGTVDHSFPEDKKIESLSDMVSDLIAMKEAGVGPEAIAAKVWRINEKIYEGNPDKQAWIRAKSAWLPFSDKSNEDAAMIVASRADTDPAKVLWENFSAIFREIEEETPNFPRMAYKLQKAVVDAKVEEFKGRVEYIGSDAPDMQPFNVTDEDANAGATN